MNSTYRSARSRRAGVGAALVRVSAAVACSLLVWPAVGAADDRIRLASGEELTVEVTGLTDELVTFVHPVLGEVSVAREHVEFLTEPPVPDPPIDLPDPEEAEAPERRLSFLEGWDGVIEGGLSGSEGNTETLDLRFGLELERLTKEMETTVGFNYSYGLESGDEVKNRAVLNLRNDWNFGDSPWGFFLQGRGEYDEFQDWRWRLSAFAGPSYAFIRTDDTLLRGRVGAGITREFGGEENAIQPEGLIGLDFRHKFTETHRVFATAEYLPSLSNWPDYRLYGRAGYEVMLSESTNMVLRLGAENRYDSSPGLGRKRNDLEYFVTIGWRF